MLRWFGNKYLTLLISQHSPPFSEFGFLIPILLCHTIFIFSCDHATFKHQPFGSTNVNGTGEGRGGERWVEKETQLKGDGGITFSFQALGDSLTEGEAGVVSPLVYSCLNRVRVLLIPRGSFLSSRSERCLKINYKVCTMA